MLKRSDWETKKSKCYVVTSHENTLYTGDVFIFLENEDIYNGYLNLKNKSKGI